MGVNTWFDYAIQKTEFHQAMLDQVDGDEVAVVAILMRCRSTWLPFVSERQAWVVASIGLEYDRREAITDRQRILFISIAYDGFLRMHACEPPIPLNGQCTLDKARRCDCWFRTNSNKVCPLGPDNQDLYDQMMNDDDWPSP